MPEILMILAIALIVIGPKKLPDLSKTLGRAMGEFKRSAQDFKQSIDVETTVKDITDIEGVTGVINSNDTDASEFKDDTISKDTDTDDTTDIINEKTDDDDNTDPPETPLKNHTSNDTKDSIQQDNSTSNLKSDTD